MLKRIFVLLLMTFCLQLMFADEPTETEEKLLENQEEMLDNQEEIIENQEEMLVILDGKRGFTTREILNVMSMPTAYTLHQNEFILGLGSVYYGISNRVQVGSNLLLFILQDRNVKIKTNLYKSSKLACATGVNYDYLALDVYGSDKNYSFLSPYGALSLKTTEKLTFHLSGQYSMYWNSEDNDIKDAEPTWFTQGSNVSVGMEISPSHRTKFVGKFAYDDTYEGTKVGGAILWGWEKLRLKFGIITYSFKNMKKPVTVPSFNIWWRFNG